MIIETVKLDALMDAAYNPRVELKPCDVEWERLKNSIEHFGYVEPIVVNKRGMVVVGGHQRLHVLRDLGVEQAEVVLVDLDENDEKALNVALNKIEGKWDAEKLEEVMRDLVVTEDFDVELTGFSKEEIDQMFDACELPDDIDDFFRETTEEEKRKKDEKALEDSKLYLTIGTYVKIEITKDQCKAIKEKLDTIGKEDFLKIIT